jgi:hypothetical protein
MADLFSFYAYERLAGMSRTSSQLYTHVIKNDDADIPSTPSQGSLVQILETEEEFDNELASLTGVYVPKIPHEFITWNANRYLCESCSGKTDERVFSFYA